MLQGMRSCLVHGEGGRIANTMAMCLGKIRGVLLDLSGTLHIENAPTSSAITALRRWDGPVISRSLVGGAIDSNGNIQWCVRVTMCGVCVAYKDLSRGLGMS